MSLTYDRCSDVARAAEGVATRLKGVLKELEQLLDTNSNLSIDWGAVALPSYLSEDGNGNLTGFKFSRQDVSNVIGSLAQVKNLLRNSAATTGDHLGNLNKLANVTA